MARRRAARRGRTAAPRVPVVLALSAASVRVDRARPRPRAWPECRERVRRPAPRHPLWGRSAPPQRVGPHPSNKTSQLLMSRQSERQRRPPRGWRRGSRSGPRVRAAANAPARNRMRRGGPAFALLRTVVWCIYMCGFSRLPSPLRCGCRRVRRRMARSPSSCLCGRRHLPGPCAQRICHGQRARRAGRGQEGGPGDRPAGAPLAAPLATPPSPLWGENGNGYTTCYTFKKK